MCLPVAKGVAAKLIATPDERVQFKLKIIRPAGIKQLQKLISFNKHSGPVSV
jgi:hypothetical protein